MLLNKRRYLLRQKEIARLIHYLKTEQATDHDKKMLDEYWQNAINETTILEEMSAKSREKLGNAMLHSIKTRLGLK